MLASATRPMDPQGWTRMNGDGSSPAKRPAEAIFTLCRQALTMAAGPTFYEPRRLDELPGPAGARPPEVESANAA